MSSDSHHLQIARTTARGADVLVVHGPLDLTTAAELRNLTFDPTLCTRPVLAVDLNAVTLLDSSGIATLVATRRWTESRQAELVLVCAVPHLLKLLQICRLDTVVRVVRSLDDLAHDGDPDPGAAA